MASYQPTFAGENEFRYYPQWMAYALTPYKTASGDTILYSGHFMDRGTTAWGFAEMSMIPRLGAAVQDHRPGERPAWRSGCLTAGGRRKQLRRHRQARRQRSQTSSSIPVASRQQSSEQLGLPLSKLFKGTGWLAMRTWWSSNADTMVTFTASPFTSAGPAYANSNHGSFTIDRGGRSRFTRSRSAPRLLGPARAYNTMIFPDPNEPVGSWPQYWDMGGQRSSVHRAVGTLAVRARVRSGTSAVSRAADLYDGSAAHDYDYVTSNLTRAYNGPANGEQYNTEQAAAVHATAGVLPADERQRPRPGGGVRPDRDQRPAVRQSGGSSTRQDVTTARGRS
jgi:hypothetical protein